MRTTPSASPPLSKVYMRASRTPRSRPPTRSSDSRRQPPPSRGPGAEPQLDRSRDQSVSLETRAGLGDDAPNPWEGAMAKGILVAAMDFSAAPEDEFHDWYDLEHVPERLRVPGFFEQRSLDRRDEPEDLGRDLRSRQCRRAQEPALPCRRRREFVALDQAHRPLPQKPDAL